MQVCKHTVVAFRYVMRNGNGIVLEDTMTSTPVNYLHGSTAILHLLQLQMEGLAAGDKKQVYLPKGNSGADDDFIFEVIIDNVRTALPAEISLGYPVEITTNICEDDCVCYT